MTTFFGKFRGKVVNNVDPLLLGRLIVLVPAVSEFPLGWAMPCVPYAGRNVGFFALPPIAANVWIEFEAGDVDYPIWTGCFWGDGEVPVTPAVPTTKVIKTETVALEINDLLTSLSLDVMTPSGPIKLDQGPDGIALTMGAASLKITSHGVELAIPASSLAVGPEGIFLTSASTTANITPASISLKNGSADINMSAASLEIKNSGANVVLSPVSVSLNNGALEVT